MSTAPCEIIIKYISTSLDILKACITEYRTMLETADGQTIDVGRLIVGWPE